MLEIDKTIISIRDAMNKRPRKVKASSQANSEDSEKDNEPISFAKSYKKKLLRKLNENRSKTSS